MLILALTTLAIAPRPLVLAHYMPWFAGRPTSGAWGWHWTMGKTDPDVGALASHYRPLAGPYDSGDPDLLEYHVQLMKLSGIDGVLIDWYGDRKCLDYESIDQNTARLIATLDRANMKYALVYEDQTVKQLIGQKVFDESSAVAEGRNLLKRTSLRWFRSPNYVKVAGRPLLLVFGPQYYREADWTELLSVPAPPTLFSLHNRVPSASGAFDWPLPSGGSSMAEQRRKEFLTRSTRASECIPVAYPRFHDFYAEAGVHASWGEIGDENGDTYRRTLQEAIRLGSSVVQIATWNDWGEGTMIEPSREFGYRDLELTQQLLGVTHYRSDDLRLPLRLYTLRKTPGVSAKRRAEFTRASTALLAGDVKLARRLLSSSSP